MPRDWAMRGHALMVPLLLLALAAACGASEGKRTLMVVDDPSDIASMQKFVNDLKSRGYELEFARAAEMPNLEVYGVYHYDALIYFAPQYEGSRVSTSIIEEFIDSGRDVIIGGSAQAGRLMRDIAACVGVRFDLPRTVALDHFHYDTIRDGGEHTVIAAENVIDSKSIIGSSLNEPVLYRGAGLSFDPHNTLVFSVLSGFSSTYSFAPMVPIEGRLEVAGTKTVLVAGLQARNNARVIVSGSLDLFTDAFATGKVASSSGKKSAKSGNEQFVREVSKWAFQERGVLRLSNVRHRRVGEEEPPEVYTVEEEIEYSLEIHELVGNTWVPFIADDVQMEFVMLDPYWRLTLKPNADGLYTTRFKAPDTYGIFQFRVDYHRLGYTGLSDSKTKVVRPYRHDEYERFIPAAFPYYASAFSMIGSVLLFSVLYLFHNEHK